MSQAVVGYLDSFLFGFVACFLMEIVGVLAGFGGAIVVPILPAPIRGPFQGRYAPFLLLAILSVFVILPLVALYWMLLLKFHYQVWGLPKTLNDLFLRIGLFLGGTVPLGIFFVYRRRI